MADIEQIIREQAEMESLRANFDKLWNEVAKRIMPYSNEFNTQRTPGTKQSELMFDSTATLALDRFVAAINDLATPASRRWHNIMPSHASLKENPEVMEYLEGVRDMLFKVRYSPKAGFSTNIAEVWKSLGAFGNAGLFVDGYIDDEGLVHIRYHNVYLGQLWFAENSEGKIDKVHRKFKYTARQAMAKFGDKCPEKIREAAQKSPEREFEFIHRVVPNEDRNPKRRDYKGMKFYSCYVSLDTKDVLNEGGYRTMPYIIGRYSGSLRSPYGISVAIQALPDIKTLNEMEKTIIRAGQMAVEPTLLASEDGALSAFRMTPGAMNYGAVDDQGRPKVMPLQNGANLPLGLELSNQRRQSINDAFLVTIFQILVEEQRQMTATEVMQRAAEKGALLGPPMGRIQTEFLGPLIEREIDILASNNVFPPPPQDLVDAGGDYEIEYSSELSRMQKAGDGVAIQRTLEGITPLAQIDPSVLAIFDIKKMARKLAEINGVPADIVKSEEDLAEEEAAQQQAAQAAALLEAAPVAAKSAKDFAQAQSIAGASPNQMLPGIIP